jgi:hypothetical protein
MRTISNGDPIKEKLERERYANDYRNLLEYAMRENVIPDPRVTGRADVDSTPYILDAVGVGELGRAIRGALGALAKRTGRRELVDNYKPFVRKEGDFNKYTLSGSSYSPLADEGYDVAFRGRTTAQDVSNARMANRDKMVREGMNEFQSRQSIRAQAGDPKAVDNMSEVMDKILDDPEFRLTEAGNPDMDPQVIAELNDLADQLHAGSAMMKPMSDAEKGVFKFELMNRLGRAGGPSGYPFQLNANGGRIIKVK